VLTPDRRSRNLFAIILAAALVAGVGVRAIFIRAAPQNSYQPDHRDNMAWSAYAWEHGPQHIYDLPSGSLILEQGPTGAVGIATVPHACNYPPLSAYVFWAQGGLWTLLDPLPKTVQVAPEIAAQIDASHVTSRVIETPISRLVQAIPSCVFDLPLAVGVGALIAALRRSARWQVAEALGFALTFLAPPIVLDSAFWNQTDSWVTTSMVWAVWALMTRRLVFAGIFWAAALLTKPQGVLLAPVFAYAFLALRFEPGGTWRRALALWRTGAALLLTVAVVTLPFVLTDWNLAGGPLRWFQRSYVETIGSDAYQSTTLKAFNVWWLHWVSQNGSPEAIDSTGESFGVRRSLLGKGLLVASLLIGGGLCARRWSWRIESCVALAGFTCLAAFLLPTSVHERYIYYCIPFLMALALADGRVFEWIALVILVAVGTFELTAFAWCRPAEPGWRNLATGLAVASCVAFVSLLVALGRPPRPAYSNSNAPRSGDAPA
jgi:hypothetical protein